uniref:Uncharacterized protein n=1 Tax=Arundo donax TaxID=35708 RepID=A0A0A9FN15_ARUDO
MSLPVIGIQARGIHDYQLFGSKSSIYSCHSPFVIVLG